MPIYDRLDEVHARVHRAMPSGLMDFDDIPSVRRRVQELRARMRSPERPADITASDTFVGRDPMIPIRIYRPNTPMSNGAVLWIHGGGMVLGDLDMEDAYCAALCSRLGAMVVQVDYRLAPEYPFPAGLEDCISVFEHLVDNAAEFGLDPERIIVGGGSAGGNLAAALCLSQRDRAQRDRRGSVPLFQFLMYPLLDDRIEHYESPSADDPKVWNADDNANAWRAYLGGRPAGSETPVLAAPARASDLSGLPPTHMCIGDLDLFLGEVLNYAARLAAASVPISLQVYSGAFHASNTFVSESELSRSWFDDDVRVMTRALQNISTHGSV